MEIGNGTAGTTEKLFALLRSEICANSLLKTEISFTAEELSELYSLSKAHDLAHIISDALYKHGIGGDAEIMGKFRKKQMLAVYRYEQLKSAYAEICEVLEKAEIPYVPLKGSVLRAFYPEEWMRTSCDIDILVHESDVERAVAALTENAQYTTDYRQEYHDISLYAKNGIHLELHFSIKENMDNIDGLLSEVWEHSCRNSSSEWKYCLTMDYFVFHHVAHMSYHFLSGGCGIKPFIDLYIMKNVMGYDEPAVRKHCERCGIGEFYDNVLYLADVWLNGASHTETSRLIEGYILGGGVYGTLENKVTVGQGRSGGKIKYALSRIFLSYEVLSNKYPVLKKHKWLFPILQVRRWFDVVLFGNLGRSINELKANQGVSKKQTAEMNKFLDKVGLR